MKNNQEKEQEMNQTEEQLADENTENVVNESEAEVKDQEEKSSDSSSENEVAALKDKYLRLYSDFENYRKRTSKERIDLITNASEDVLKDLIPVVDDFERSLKASENEEDGTKVREGNQLIFQKLLKILGSKGLKPMDDLVGKSFDPDTQEAITQIPSPSEDMKGKVVDVIEKGYTLGEKVVRFAKVVTGA